LTNAALDRARAAGHKTIFLDTALASMAAAHRMYLELGFQPCAPYNDNPVADLVYLSRRL
jgi:putative acetyltransferase